MSWTNANGDPIPGPTDGSDIFRGDDSGTVGSNIRGRGGNDTLVGGTGSDQLFGDAGDDSIVDLGGALNELSGGSGDDTLSVAGTTGANTLFGGTGNDLLTGGLGASLLFGDRDNDTLVGGRSADILDGGGNLDTADYSNETTALTVVLDAAGNGQTTGAGIGTDTLIGIENIIGGSGGDSIVSTAGTTANRFEGGGGNDTLRGGGGADTLDGGGDSDTADYTNETAALTVVLDAAGNGQTTGAGIGTDTLVHIENVIGGAGGDSIVSTAGSTANRFEGGGGRDTLIGGGGNDTLDGGAGYDSILGGEGADLITDSSSGGRLFGEGGDDTIAVTLAGAHFGLPTSVSGGSGNDLITATGTGTEASGGRVSAEMSGDEGNDTLVASDANDSSFFGGDDLYGGAGDDSLVGSLGDNWIGADETVERNGTSAGTDVVDAGAGNDRVWSYGGADTLEGGIGFDIVEVIRSVPTDLGFTVDGAGRLTGSEGLVATGFERFFITSGDGDDTILSGQGDDRLRGGAGADTIAGNAGNDRIDGDDAREQSIAGAGAGADVVDAGAGDDSVFSFGGADTLEGDIGNDLAGVYRTVTTDLGFTVDGAGALTSSEGLTATGFERFEISLGAGNDTIISGQANDVLFGGAGADIIAGNAGDDVIWGQAGNDTLSGGDGNDTLDGGAGNDTLLGGAGDDLVLGGAGDDSIVATPGRDTIEGQAGNDVIDTGEDDDLVIWRVGDGNDVVAMGSGSDTLDLEGWTGSDSDFWSVSAGGAGAIYTYDDGAGNVFSLTTSGVETVTCFAEGTRILTQRGEVPVEQLRAGDLVVAPGRGAPLKPVRWVGRTRLDIAHHRDKRKVAPILIRAGALGGGTPARDLRVSPEHAFLLQGRLVPAHLLVNGSTIVQELWHRTMTYWHVELDEHGVLVAEGALAESYFDDGNRHLFDNGVIALHADLGAGREAGRYATMACAPPVMDANDPVLARIRAALPAAPVLTVPMRRAGRA